MVLAYKSVEGIKSNNKDNRLSNLIKTFTTGQKLDIKTSENKVFVDKAVQNLAVNSIIEGYFPKEKLVKEIAIKRVNKTLCIILTLLILVVVISYYFVVSCEIKLNNISRQTIMLNNENEELQNKLDKLKSFSNVDQTLEKNKMTLGTGQVIETSEIAVPSEELTPKEHKNKIFNSAIGF